MNTKANNTGLPKSPVEGLIPTLNNTGWMTEALDDISQAFADYAGSINTETLDIGCAYGIATLAALEQGATICACDIEPRHLEILTQRVPAEMTDRFRCVAGALPDVDFPDEQFGAIIASRVLHFLSGADVETTVKKMHRWLKPGGRLFLIVDSPYTGPGQNNLQTMNAVKRPAKTGLPTLITTQTFYRRTLMPPPIRRLLTRWIRIFCSAFARRLALSRRIADSSKALPSGAPTEIMPVSLQEKPKSVYSAIICLNVRLIRGSTTRLRFGNECCQSRCDLPDMTNKLPECNTRVCG